MFIESWPGFGRFRIGERGLAQVILPAATESLDDLNGGDQALAGELGAGTLRRKSFAVCVHDFEVTDDAGLKAIGCEVGGSARVDDGAVLGRRLVREMTNGGEAIFHFAKSDKNLLTIARDA